MVTVETIRVAVESVLDPELPVLTIADLGVLRSVEVDTSGRVAVTITPTYSGCPAMQAIQDDVEAAALSCGAREVEVRTVLSPAWSTDWISTDGRRKLAAAGIAPPSSTVQLRLSVRCPQCGSPDTREVSHFGSTACKALYTCQSCREPFDHVKAL